MSDSNAAHVGPVLEAGAVAQALIRAIREQHPEAEVLDRGAYLRVRVPDRCAIKREAIERALGHSFKLPGDLEQVMPSFQGALFVSQDEVAWEAKRR
jgi:hypothetical protein